MRKLKAGFFSFTGDEGCMIVLIELMNDRIKEWKDKIDFRYMKLLKSNNDMRGLDVAFVEGAISTFEDEKRIREIRNNSKRLVAIGSCAVNGSPSNWRNFFSPDTMNEIRLVLDRFGHRQKVSPLSDVVTVDEIVPGCPMDEGKFLEVLGRYLNEFKVAGCIKVLT
jgi:coenzyme F420-reducing hydrogenase gamma subunit